MSRTQTWLHSDLDMQTAATEGCRTCFPTLMTHSATSKLARGLLFCLFPQGPPVDKQKGGVDSIKLPLASSRWQCIIVKKRSITSASKRLIAKIAYVALSQDRNTMGLYVLGLGQRMFKYMHIVNVI
ncbi:hypothetical protein KIL84_017982 [Mauremys mutica]|uniref:Uncharacterized protein n=1 Tax=Mauremys mutica TaxID=74926 RepID=A0A9D4B8J7_9SAUR|nr:hypothetical protein KIL84_017982 [Mauremys mutica]